VVTAGLVLTLLSLLITLLFLLAAVGGWEDGVAELDSAFAVVFSFGCNLFISVDILFVFCPAGVTVFSTVLF